MIERSLDNMNGDAELCTTAREGPPEIVQGPFQHIFGQPGVESFLGTRKSFYGRFARSRENIAGLARNTRKPFQDL